VQFVYDDGAAASELELRVEHPAASVADLAAALHAPRADLCIDGRTTPGSLGLDESGLVAGSLVSSGPRTTATSAPPGTAVLRVVGGLDAGTSLPLGPGSIVVGRGRAADLTLRDPALSRTHCRIHLGRDGEVTVTDDDSLNGTDVDGIPITKPTPVGPDALVTLGGAVQLRVLPAERIDPAVQLDPLREAGAGGTIPFSRPPRIAAPPDPEPLPLPAAPPQRANATFSIAALLAPLAMAAATAAVLKDLRFAALSLLSPLMVLANFVEARSRGRRSMRRDVREYTEQLQALRERMVEHRKLEMRRRRELLPDPAEVVARAHAPSPRLWERRADAPDFLLLGAGSGDLSWQPPLREERGGVPSEVRELLADLGPLPGVPVPVDLSPGGVVGLEGDRGAALAVARSLLCQAVVTSGPADLTVAVFVDADRVGDWEWAKWLPHVLDRRGGSGRLLSVGADAVDALAKELLEAGREQSDERPGPALLLVVDGATLTEGRPCPLRELLAGKGGPASGIVLTRRLPALCTVTMTLRDNANAELRRPASAELVPDILPAGISEPSARGLARALARFEDPELGVEGAGLPDQVTLPPLLELPELSPAAISARWRESRTTLRATAPLGVTEHGIFRIDLDDDGPHALIAGTTGSGKSELLRTLVASLAAGNDPEHLTFALIDYKGGGALDECARLPHVVGLVTDLDEHLGERALRCLEAELRHRERLFREAKVSHVRDYQRARDAGDHTGEPMPRLVVVIDEFAALVKALPEFVDSLIGIAQRGRSLGVHLVMATQRPAGSVSEAIKNNVKLRIALRLESASDSQDVIDSPAAAMIGGRQWGRAFHKVSAREVQAVQTALSTATTADLSRRGPVSVAPFGFERTAGGVETATDGPTDLSRLVDATTQAFASQGFAAPRQPWPEPLPTAIEATTLPSEAQHGLLGAGTGRGLATIALADDPDRQAQYPVGWDPTAGNLLLYGTVGAGTTTALASLGLALARRLPPDGLHLYVLDFGAGDLAPLEALPHTGAYVPAGARERQVRLVRLLNDELDRRKAGGTQDRLMLVVLIDGIASLVGDFDKDMQGLDVLGELGRVYADGPAVGIAFAVTADRAGAVPGPWAATTQHKLLFQLADVSDHALFGIPRNRVPAFRPGRAVVATTGQVVQMAWPGASLADAVAAAARAWPGVARTAPGVGVLPARLTLASLDAPARTESDPWWLPLGLGDRTLTPIGLQLYEHEHALVAGPARSGRSTVLCTLAEAMAAAEVPPAIVGLAPRRSPLRSAPSLTHLASDYTELCRLLQDLTAHPLVLLVDDAEVVDDHDGVLARLLESPQPHLHVVAAGRTDTLRRAYGHWTQKVRESRCGLLLVPDVDMDGDLVGVTLPRVERLPPIPGRGYLASNGTVEVIQVGLPTGMQASST
jgi:S-DNA-T family DNA segregation ATPase FtsK/SpoIIIE